MSSEVEPDESATNAIISSLTSYADSDEEIGNTPNDADKELESVEKPTENGVVGAELPPSLEKPAEDIATEPINEKSAPNSEIGEDAYADTEIVEGSNAGGDYNMLPSEFDSDDDKQFSDEDSEKRKTTGGPGKGNDASMAGTQGGGLVSYTEPGDEIEDEDEYNRGAERGSDSSPDDANGDQDRRSPSANEASADTDDVNEEEDIPDWLKKADLSAPNAFAALLYKVKPKREELVLPPLPRKRCSKELEQKYEKHHLAMKRGKDFIKVVESSTTYRNPSIYEKLVEHLHINEKGTNFPKSVFNPRGFPRSAYYDELAKIQNELHAKKQQQAKNSPQTQSMSTSNVVITTIVPPSSNTANPADKSSSQGAAAKAEEPISRKTKWDIPPPSSNTSGSSTGTLIPASGPLKKPKVDI